MEDSVLRRAAQARASKSAFGLLLLRRTSLTSDDDRLYECHQRQANFRILDVDEIKTVPYVPLAHPFVERLVGTIRRECLDRMSLLDGRPPGTEASSHCSVLGLRCQRCVTRTNSFERHSQSERDQPGPLSVANDLGRLAGLILVTNFKELSGRLRLPS
jgi:hypothetical protein